MEYSAADIARMIDHSLLRPELTTADIVAGCAIARRYNVAAVCCASSDVAICRDALAGSDVAVAAVVGFPHGYVPTEVKVAEAARALEDGARELDMVLHIGRLLSGDFDYMKADITAVVDTAHARGARVKVILENCYLTDPLKRAGSGSRKKPAPIS